MRISLARALFMEPTLLLLDEPTNHLDLNAVIWLESYLQKWKNTLLVVSHDQDFLDGVVTDIMHLEDRKLAYYRGQYEQFKDMYTQNVTKAHKDWDKQQKAIRRAKAKGKTKKEAEASVGALLPKPDVYRVDFDFGEAEPLSAPILEVMDAGFRYGDEHPVLFENLNFGVDMTTRASIVGPNGVGKSTLVKMLIGELEPTEGDVRRNRFLNVGMYSQHFADKLPMDQSPVDFLAGKRAEKAQVQSARAILGRFGLEAHAHLIPVSELSGGQKARVVFASLASEDYHILFFDEPTNHLDIESIDALADGIDNFNGGVVIVSHDARLLRLAECELWVVGDLNCKPFGADLDEYRDSLIEAIEEQEAEAEAVAMREEVAKSARRKAARESRLERWKALGKAKSTASTASAASAATAAAAATA
jgi:ATP-binding cassette subfamily F protein 1